MLRVVVRALEWRARRFSDPVDRLQFLRRNIRGPAKPRKRWRRVLEHMPAFAIALGLASGAVGFLLVSPRRATVAANSKTLATRLFEAPAIRSAAQPLGPVWLVQNTAQFDLYSNGLRIENQYATATESRRYLAFSRDGSPLGAAGWRSEPAGIVFHTTESHIAPFDEGQNQVLQRAGEGVLEYVNRIRAYHFVIDRFGRVFREVRESDYANHAGNSVWADSSWIYINLNESFLGVAFEARSTAAGTGLPITAAQVHAARILTEMLRSRYRIPAANCVTHAQVSVNPGNLEAGYHVDWAANLPFAELGLADNYQRPLPSMTLFGFRAGSVLLQQGGASLSQGIESAEQQIARDAAAQGQPVEQYRKTLQKRYADAIRALRGNAAHQTIPNPGTTKQEYH